MDVSSPISSVIPSLDGPVYSALSSTNAPMTLGAVHRLTEGASKSGVRTVLLRMVASGLVDLVPGGYRLNREHLAAGPIEALASIYGELTKRIRAEVDSWQPKPLLVGFYGSAARGTEMRGVTSIYLSSEMSRALAIRRCILPTSSDVGPAIRLRLSLRAQRRSGVCDASRSQS